MVLCYFCQKPVGKKFQKHHVHGKANSNVTAKVHVKCHLEYHKTHKGFNEKRMGSIDYDHNNILFEEK